MQPLDHLWEMMKTTSRLVLGFFFCVAVSAEENIVVFEVGSGDPAFTQLKADSFANKAIRNSAYLHFTNKTSFKSCWQKYINNKEIKIGTTGVNLKVLSRNSNFYQYELRFDPKKFSITGASREQFLEFCNNESNYKNEPKILTQKYDAPNNEQPSNNNDAFDAIEVKIIFDENSITDGLVVIPTQITSEDTQIDY